MVTPRRGRWDRAVHATGAARNGLRRTRRFAADHGPLHHDPVPGRLCRVWAFADPGARPGLVAGADDRGHHPANPWLEWKSRTSNRIGVDTRADGRGDHD